MRIAEYLRRSTRGEEAKNYSIETQHDDIAAWAARNGHTIVATYSDPGGKSYTLNRPVFQRMLADAPKGLFDMVVVGRYDRFARAQDIATVAIWQFKQAGVSVASATEQLPDGAVGEFVRGGILFAAQTELNHIRERTYTGKRARVHSGKLPPLNAPKYGYQFADDDTKEAYVLDPVTAPIVERIFREYVGGKTLRGIAEMLTAEGIPTPSQYLLSHGWRQAWRATLHWNPNTIAKMLGDPSYMGRMAGFAYKYTTGTAVNPVTGEVTSVTKKIRRSQDDPERFEYGPEVCPPIVSEELFQSAQAAARTNRALASRNLRRPNDLLLRHGMVVCGWCGGGVSGVWNTSHGKYRYACNAKRRRRDNCPSPAYFSIAADELEAAVWEWFVDHLTHPERLRQQYDAYLENVGSVQKVEASTRTATVAAIQEAHAQEESYLAAVGTARTDEMRARFVGLAEDAHTRANDLEAMLAALGQEQARRETQLHTIRTFQEAAPQALHKLQTATIAQRRTILYRFQVQTTFWGRDHTPPYAISWVFDDMDCVDFHNSQWTQYMSEFISA